MSSAMRMMNAMVLVVTLGVGHSPAGAQESAFEERHERRTNFLVGKAHLMADVARQGAIRRLSRPACQQVLDEFTDSAGRALTTNLAAMGLSAAEALTALYLVDAGDAMQCRTNDGVVAFTTTRGRVIYVCGKHFVERATRRGNEIVLIHELLHTLGLGENPPTSSEITKAVSTRCG